jgi:hypothetical protein
VLPADLEWALDPYEARAASLDQVDKLLKWSLAEHFRLINELNDAEDMETYKEVEKEWFKLKNLQTVLMALLKSPVG